FEFTFSSGATADIQFKTRPGQGVDLQLIGSKELVLYNAHRCCLHIGQPRHETPQLSHHPSIKQRSMGTDQDQVEVRSALQLWKIGCSNQLEEAFVDEDIDLMRAYAHKIQKLRFKKPPDLH